MMRIMGLLVVGMLVGGCGMVQQPTAKVSDVSMGNMSMKAATLVFNVEVTRTRTAWPCRSPGPTTPSRRAASGSWAARPTSRAPCPPTAARSSPSPSTSTTPTSSRPVQSVRGKSEIPYTADLGLRVDAPVVGTIRVPTQKNGTLKLPHRPERHRPPRRSMTAAVSAAAHTRRTNLPRPVAAGWHGQRRSRWSWNALRIMAIHFVADHATRLLPVLRAVA